ncbi:uncharacterized protein LOC143861431 isoform X2 [Tasmannia lanceolata]|uniref:uncharacterized protein LOC143861431 isoform X2 n=1 Tax=Tasmannia lanceolata TaxID=3420 RepID=UPI0040642434
MAKNGKNKSARKPLTEISNNRNPPKSNKKITKDEEDGALDRLLLAQSDLTNLIHQIDELVSQAFKHKLTCKMRNQEIESFTHVLSDMNSSLKSWVPRFQQAFSSPSTESVNHLASSLPINTVSAGNNERKNVHNISEELELDTLISPSPLVSWPTGCRIESGRQLFLLTPLPRSKVLSSKRPGSSRVDVKSPKFFSKSDVTKTESTLEFGLVSPPPQFSNHKDHSMYLMTPLSKMSPLKTCMLLEPVSESLQQSNSDIPKLSTLAVRIQNCDDSPTPKSCNGEVSEVLSSKYSKLFGFLPLNHKSAIRREQIETSPDWFFSPPKTCILMEPPNDKLPINPAISDFPSSECPFNKQAIALFSAPEKKACDGCQSTKDFFNCELLSARLAAPENTPMLNGSESTLRTGKRPGENTLKRELWTKFEAVSTDALHFDASLFKETKGIGFLDRLEEEAFCEEMFLRPKSLR